MTFPQAPQSNRGALMLPQQGQRWLVGLGGRGADKPPGDEAGFLDLLMRWVERVLVPWKGRN
jgi:hypothetical protein